MQEESYTVRITASSKTRGALARAVGRAGGLHVLSDEAAGPCDLSIIEIGDDPEEGPRAVGGILASGEAGEVFLTSGRRDPDMLINAMRAGAREFFAQPIDEAEVEDALLKFKGRAYAAGGRGAGRGRPGPMSEKDGKVIALFGAKGGVGTTTVAVNLAASLAGLEGGLSAVLVDLDLSLGETPLFLGVKPVFDWTEIGDDISRLDATYLTSIILRHSSGLHLLCAPAAPLDGRAPMPETVGAVLAHLRRMFDFIVIDGGRASFDAVARTVMSAADTLLLVANPTLPCVVNLGRLIDAFQTLGCPADDSIGIVFNRHNQDAGISLAQAERTLRKKVSWLIPNDYKAAINAINNGEPLCAVTRAGELNAHINRMAAEIAGRAGRKDKKGAGKGFFFGLLSNAKTGGRKAGTWS